MNCCNNCQKIFCNHQKLTQHLNKVFPCHQKKQCSKCLKEFSSYNKLKKHFDRKKPCIGVAIANNTYQCNFCLKHFTRKDNMLRHQTLYCKNAEIERLKAQIATITQAVNVLSNSLDNSNIIPININLENNSGNFNGENSDGNVDNILDNDANTNSNDNNNDADNNENNNINNNINNGENNNINNNVNNSESNNENSNANNNENNSNNSNIIDVNRFGKENVEFISKDMLMDLIKKYASNLHLLHITLTEWIYFNNEHLENKNIKMQNIRDKRLKIMTKNGEKYYNADSVVPRIIIRNDRLIKKHIPENENAYAKNYYKE